MAKKIIISDLVLKLSVDSKNALRNLKKVDSQLDKTGKKEKKRSKSELKDNKQKWRDAKAYATNQKNLSKLKELDYKKARQYERQLVKAKKNNDKYEVSKINEKIRLKVKDNNDTLTGIQAQRTARRRADKEAKTAIKQRGREQRRQAYKNQKAMRKVGRGLSGVGAVPMGGVGMAGLGVGMAMGFSGASLLQFRRSEMAYKASMNVSGSESNQEEMFKKIQANARYYNADKTQYLQQFASTRSAVKADKLSDNELLYGQQGMSLARMMSGATQPALDKAMFGLQQILTSGIQAQEIRQITENMTAAAPAVFEAIGKLTGKKVEGMGAVRTLAQQGALANVDPVDFYKVFTDVLNTTYKDEFEKVKNTLPYIYDRMSVVFKDSMLIFAEGFQDSMKATFQDVTTFMVENEDRIRKWGETLGNVTAHLWEVAKVIGAKLEPMFMRMSDYITSMKPEEIATMLKYFFYGFLALKTANVFGNILKSIPQIIAFAGSLKILASGLFNIAKSIMGSKVGQFIASRATVGMGMGSSAITGGLAVSALANKYLLQPRIEDQKNQAMTNSLSGESLRRGDAFIHLNTVEIYTNDPEDFADQLQAISPHQSPQ